MSTDRKLLKQPLVIAGAAMGLIVVALLNFHTFLGVGGLLGLGSGHGEVHMAPPPDLADAVRDAMHTGRSQRPVSAAQQGSGPGLARDPFTGGVPVATIQQPAARRTEQRPRVRPLVCTAVFLGGHRPQVLIDDETYGPGDKVRGMEVVSIDAEGVWLRRPDGTEIHLDVASTESSPAGYHLITGVRGADDRAGTGSAGSSANEGTER